MTDEDEQKVVRMFGKLAANRELPKIHEPMDPTDLLDILNERGEAWRVVWESIPTDSVFDALYAESAKYEAFLYEGQIFERVTSDDGMVEWEIDIDVFDWLIEHVPFDPCVAIADLYQFSAGIEAEKQPWLLFQYVIGVAVTTQGAGLNSLMDIGVSDAVMLGRALEAWGEYADVVEPYLNLLIENSEGLM